MSHLEIRSASIEEALPVLQAIPEFASPVTNSDVSARLDGKRSLILIAFVDGQAAGVKIGYEQSGHQFYSWLGGVLPSARGYGVAQALLNEQEKWAKQQGYRSINVKTRNQFPQMIHMLVKNRYLIVATEAHPNPLENRLYFQKNL
ncbi:acetyltransferase [Vibrio sp. qd031]|uniref:GNAT family N-acetyltransferase n=1 Tax=Vibrio sp. qd031 TaxID=1603038 RepID=UPI000A119836|nr:GNAT family N-acetyltransferase [Vibrio sp. qd031]ORT51691.1 acetyltransferase [Vibrio sp. qd031]